MALEVLGRRRLTPLAPGGTGGAGGSSAASRSAAPRLITGALPYGAGGFEDFTTATVTNAAFGSGLIASVDTPANAAPLGSPPWVASEIVGTTGTVQLDASTGGGVYNGICSISSGTTAGNIVALDLLGSQAASASQVIFWDSTHSCIFQARYAFSASTNCIMGIGAVTGANVGTDWVSTPDITLAATPNFIIHRNTSAYSGDGAGELIFRNYSTTGATDTSVLIAASVSTGTYNKVEVYIDGPNARLYLYYNEALVSGFPITVAASGSGRISAQSLVSAGATTRRVNVDSFYWENQLTAAR